MAESTGLWYLVWWNVAQYQSTVARPTDGIIPVCNHVLDGFVHGYSVRSRFLHLINVLQT